MSLLALEGVGRRYGRGAHERVVLRAVSLELDAGELVAIWGLRRSGRSTLLRVAAGIEPPDTGVVRFAGSALDGTALGGGIGYCQPSLRDDGRRSALDELLIGQLARGVQPSAARTRAWSALARTAAEHCAALALHELDAAEAVRVAIARALALEPTLLLLDEPTKGVDLLERDAILALVRSLADDGIAVLMSAGDAATLAGADRALSLSDGELHGSPSPELARVVPLRRRAGA